MDLGYAYANARIKGMKSNLLDSNALRELMQVKTIDEVTALLEQTPYKQDLIEASKRYEGVQRIDVALHSNFARTIEKVARIIPAKDRKLFEMLMVEWDAENFKRILSKKSLGQEASKEDVLGMDPKKKVFYEKLLGAKTLAEGMQLIASKWGSKRFKNAMRELAGKNPDLKSAIREIDFEKGRSMLALSKNASPLTQKIIKQKLAFENAMVILRLRKEGVKKPANMVVFKNALVSKLLETEDYDESIKITAHAFGLQPEAIAKAKVSLASFEIALEKKTVERILSLTRMSVLEFATALGFVYLKGVEVSNLRKIAYANVYGLKEELGEYVFAINA